MERDATRFKPSLQPSLAVEAPKKRLQRIVLYDTPGNVKVEQIHEGLQYLTEGGMVTEAAIAATRIRFFTKRGERTRKILEAHPLVRQEILRAGRIFVG